MCIASKTWHWCRLSFCLNMPLENSRATESMHSRRVVPSYGSVYRSVPCSKLHFNSQLGEHIFECNNMHQVLTNHSRLHTVRASVATIRCQSGGSQVWRPGWPPDVSRRGSLVWCRSKKMTDQVVSYNRLKIRLHLANAKTKFCLTLVIADCEYIKFDFLKPTDVTSLFTLTHCGWVLKVRLHCASQNVFHGLQFGSQLSLYQLNL